MSYTHTLKGDDKLSKVIDGIIGKIDNLTEAVQKTDSKLVNLTNKTFFVNLLQESLQKLGTAFQSAIQPGIALDTSLKDLSAISGVTGAGLKAIELSARASAKTFGIEASGAVESYKLILSQLGPHLAQSSKGMQLMGNHIATLSKTMGGDAAAAAGVLTTAMNQYKIDTSNATAAAKKMGEMMNVMSAAAKEGSAELPQINAALEKSGMVASSAGVSFAELNAAIQVLDKAGKKGSEGGVAISNVIQEIGKGRFAIPEVRKELARYGISTDALADKNKTLAERLRLLAPLQKDSALLSKMFGTANSAAALALIQGVDAVEDYTQKITGTNTAVEQADVIMGGYSEKVKRVTQWFNDLKISVFNLTKEFMPYVQTIGSGITEVGMFAGSLYNMHNAFRLFDFKGMVGGLRNWALWTRIGRIETALSAKVSKTFAALSLKPLLGGFKNLIKSLKSLNLWTRINTAATALWGRATKITAAAGALFTGFITRLRTINLWTRINALSAAVWGAITKTLGRLSFKGLIGQLKLVNVWTRINALAMGIWRAVTRAAVFTGIIPALRAVGVAIMNIPIVGWIAAAIAGLIWLGKTLWDKSKGFRVKLFEIWEVVKYIFSRIKNFFKQVFGPVFSWLKKWVLDPFIFVFKGIWNYVKKIFNWIGDKLGWLFKGISKLLGLSNKEGGIAEARKRGRAKGEASWAASQKEDKEDGYDVSKTHADGVKNADKVGVAAPDIKSVAGKEGGGSGIKNIYIQINEGFVKHFTLHTQTFTEGVEKGQELLKQAFAQLINDAQTT